MVYYKYWENGRWNLGRMNVFKAIICKWFMGEDFHFVSKKNVKITN